MPNHIHLILPLEVDPSRNRSRVAGLLGHISRRARIAPLWEPLPPPQRIPDRRYLKQMVRYIALNPCRKNLCRDPLSWPWSTYRELWGATPEKTVSLHRLALEFGDSHDGFAERFHRFVSNDATVQIGGTPLPKPAIPGAWAGHPIGAILEASASALRVSPNGVKERGPLRPLFLHLAKLHGWHDTSLLANICGLSGGGVRRILSAASPAPASISAAELCLGDPRLRSFISEMSASVTNTHRGRGAAAIL